MKKVFGWHPIETAPKDGTVVDLWVQGTNSALDFYCPTATKVKGKDLWHGRVTNMIWRPELDGWFNVGGLNAYMPAEDALPTHWRLPPTEPLF